LAVASSDSDAIHPKFLILLVELINLYLALLTDSAPLANLLTWAVLLVKYLLLIEPLKLRILLLIPLCFIN